VDEAKHARTLRERGIGFDDPPESFEGPIIISQDPRRNYGEERFRAVGESEGNISACRVYLARRVRIISVRRAHRKGNQAVAIT
jgi:hypothetical protein